MLVDIVRTKLREAKPRSEGLTFLIDAGRPVGFFTDVISSYSDYIDGVKFGWCTAQITPQLDEKIRVLKKHNIPFWFGGTFFELAYNLGQIEKFVEFVRSSDCGFLEISDGTVELSEEDRSAIIRDFSSEFEVFSEVGCKDSSVVLSPSVWVRLIQRDIEAGASRVIAEGRESGNAGIFREDGSIRLGLIDDIELSGIDMSKIIFEAPQKAQQVWFIKRFGGQVNFGNISFDDVLNLESLRLGLRADTAGGVSL